MEKSRIGLDCSALCPEFKSHAGRGIGRYVTELARNMPQESEYIQIHRFDYHDFSPPRMIDKTIALLPCGRQTIRQQLCYPFQLSSGKFKRFEALHFPAHMDAPTWSRRPCIVTVLDLIPLLFSDLYKSDHPGWRFRLARALELRAIRNASMILAISKCTAQDVVRVLGIPEERVRVTPLGVDSSFSNAEVPLEHVEENNSALELGSERPVILYVGGIDQRKNVGGLLSIMKNVVTHYRGQPSEALEPILVIAGGIQNDRNYPALLQDINDKGLQDYVRLPGYVPDEQMKALMKRSSLFLFPSLYEGFGLPPLEAMASGLPVVAARNSSLPEVLGEAAAWFTDYDYDVAASEAIRLIDNPEHHRAMSSRGRVQSRHFTWEKTAALTLKAYEDFAHSRI